MAWLMRFGRIPVSKAEAAEAQRFLVHPQRPWSLIPAELRSITKTSEPGFCRQSRRRTR